MVRYEVAAGGAGISVSMVVEPFHSVPGAGFSKKGVIECLLLRLREAQGRLQVEAGAGEQIAGQDFTGYVIHHDVFDKPGPPFGQ